MSSDLFSTLLWASKEVIVFAHLGAIDTISAPIIAQLTTAFFAEMKNKKSSI
jgi:hypothetical protein